MRSYVTKSRRVSQEQQILLNVSTLMGKGTVEAGGKKYDAKAVKVLVQKRLDAKSNVDQHRAEFRKAVSDERALLEATDPELALVLQALLVKYHYDTKGLELVGLAPPKKRRPMTSQEAVAAAAKAKATRERRSADAAPAPAPAIPPNPITPPSPIAPVVVNGANAANAANGANAANAANAANGGH